jgi:hypothetical protein
MCIAICFNIVVLNFMIAVLADTYYTFDSKSNGLYLSKILNSRDEMTYEPSFGAFLVSLPPVSGVQIFFLPFLICLPPRGELTLKVNNLLMKIQYSIFMSVFFVIFAVAGACLLPFSYFVGIADKIATLDQ